MWTGNPTYCSIHQHTHSLHPRYNATNITIEQQSPVRTQNNLLSQNSIPAPEATVPDTPEAGIPKSLNGEGVKNSRKQATTSTTDTQDGRLCFRCKQPSHLKKDCPSYPTVLNVELEVTSQQSVLQNNRTTDSRTKDTKLRERIGRNHRTDHSSPTRPTNALTVQMITELRTVQQNVNHTHTPLATQLVVQVFTKIVHNLKITLPNSTHNKVSPQ